ncbi:MAG: peptide chain release factor 1 [Anaerolineae bacterium]|nr:peptide chain release factor 1 [Anaerolineae bacterium]
MFDKLAGIESRYQEIERLLADNATLNDYSKVTELAQERSDIEPIVASFRDYRRMTTELEDAKAMVEAESDPDLRQMALEEYNNLVTQVPQLEQKLKTLLVPKDKRDDKNVIIEIRAGTGGDEAGLFAADLLRLYMRYAEVKRWKTEIISQSESGIGGYSMVTFEVRGKGAYSRFKYESGVHRVQRVPATEAAGRIHTSTATVAVLAQADEVDVKINNTDLRIDYFRSSGAGGQHVNKTESAVRITHIPTNVVVEVQDERRQQQNLAKAMEVLRARLFEAEAERVRNEANATRRSQIGSGERSEKIRTYNYPQSRVTDHRIGYSSYNLAAVMEGDLDGFIDRLNVKDQTEALGGVYTPGSDGSDDDE